MNYTEFRKNKGYLSSDRREETRVIKSDLCDFFWMGRSKEEIDRLNIIPNDDPLLGIIGYTLFIEESGAEVSINLQMKFSKEAVAIMYNDRGLFNEAFEKAWESEKPLCIHDDPLRRLCGFIVDSRDSREWHYIRLSDYKE